MLGILLTKFCIIDTVVSDNAYVKVSLNTVGSLTKLSSISCVKLNVESGVNIVNFVASVSPGITSKFKLTVSVFASRSVVHDSISGITVFGSVISISNLLIVYDGQTIISNIYLPYVAVDDTVPVISKFSGSKFKPSGNILPSGDEIDLLSN